MTSFREAFKRRVGAAGMRVAAQSEPEKPGTEIPTPVTSISTPTTTSSIPRPPKRK